MLLKNLFSDDCRPSLRWLRTQTAQRRIPFIKIGHMVFFDEEAVRRSMAEKAKLKR